MDIDLTADIPKAGIPELVTRSQTGDRCAFDLLVRYHQDRAMQAAVRILADVHEASEAVQDGFVSAWLKIKHLKDPEKFGPWLLRIIVNAANDRLRRIVRRKMRFSESIHLENAGIDDRSAQASDLESAIQAAMSRLSKVQARAIALFGIEDLSHKEVAEILDCSPQAARWHVFQARKKLKLLLQDYLE